MGSAITDTFYFLLAPIALSIYRTHQGFTKVNHARFLTTKLLSSFTTEIAIAQCAVSEQALYTLSLPKAIMCFIL